MRSDLQLSRPLDPADVPALVFGLYTRWFRAEGLLGSAGGASIGWGSSDGVEATALKPLRQSISAASATCSMSGRRIDPERCRSRGRSPTVIVGLVPDRPALLLNPDMAACGDLPHRRRISAARIFAERVRGLRQVSIPSGFSRADHVRPMRDPHQFAFELS